MGPAAFVVSLALGATAAAQDAPTAPAPPPPAQGEGVVEAAPADPAVPAPPGCDVRARLAAAEAVFVACADGSVLELRSGRLLGRVEGEPVALFERGGRLWVEVVRRSAVALGPAAPEGGGTTSPLTPSVPPTYVTPSQTVADGAPAPSATQPAERPPPDLDPEAPYAARIAPPRVPGWELGTRLRPFLGDGSGGFIADAWLGWRAEAPFFARLELDPFGYSVGGTGEFGQFHGFVVVGYDHPSFEMGVGGGFMRVRIEEFVRRADGLAPTVVAPVRLGARDGLHLQATTSFVFIEGSPLFAGTVGQLQFPLKQGRWLVFRGGGGGPPGFAFGEVGIRLLVRGSRGRGSLFVTPALGGVTVDDDVAFASNGGFLLSLGVELRP